ncbi:MULTISPECIES: HD domain-containing protein [unclassified Thioalkalivibrio]|uniref:HD domain-containing protein n=1 Tax=unclassified Thioalkalivibrio TaxID=2621013 RepID=UPI0003740FED|nr:MULTISPECIES: HD domain-containing protein [unclassified Thioalkalivibrio]
MVTNLEERARSFAALAHIEVGQLRKYTDEPYIVHPAAVAGIVRGVPHTPQMLAAAWLHDTVEDTRVELSDIRAEFGSEVEELVYWLTDVSRPEDGNRETRKAIDRAHLARAPAAAQTVKLADLIDNSRSILEHDPDFARVYIREKDRLLDVLCAGDSHLHTKARNQVCQARNHLETRDTA